MKFITQLNDLAFATRLRLLTERIQQDGAKVYRSLNVEFEPRWFALFYLLEHKSPIGVTEAAALLGYTQPAVTQTANIMIKKGLVKVSKEKSDTRKRLMALSDKGKSLAAKLKPVWQAFEEATNELFRDTGFDVMLVISRLERELEKKDLFTRINEKVKHTLAKQVEIVPFRPEYRSAFKELNYEWLKKYFRVEETDRKILGDPEKSILKNGGFIYFGKIDEEILGTGALVNHGNHTYEIVKMAVTERAQGKQIGRKLAEKLIAIAREKKAKRVILETSRKLETAIHLYRSLGFETVERGQSSKYERPTMSMELQL